MTTITEYIPHLTELRKRIIRAASLLSILFLAFFLKDESLYTFIATPLLTHFPAGSALIATEVISPFMVPMKLAWVATLIIAMPYLLFEIWSFVAPGLKTYERRWIFPLVLSSTTLFYAGMIFSYYVICPLALSFFSQCAPKGVTVMTDIRNYLDFVLTLLLAGGLAFQVPVVTYALIKTQCVSILLLTHLRPYVIVGAFVLGMLLTPPDVVSQILLALPMWALFEAGLLCGRYF